MIQIIIKDIKYQTHIFEEKEGKRFDLGISSCGYVTIYNGDGTCVYKESLKEIRSIHYPTPLGNFVSYCKR